MPGSRIIFVSDPVYRYLVVCAEAASIPNCKATTMEIPQRGLMFAVVSPSGNNAQKTLQLSPARLHASRNLTIVMVESAVMEINCIAGRTLNSFPTAVKKFHSADIGL